MDRVEFGLQLRAAREERGLSQSQLSKLIGVPQSAIDRIEKGQSEVSRHTPTLARYFNIGEAARQEATVPMVGYIGAGAEVFPVDDHQKGDGLEMIQAPPGVFQGIALTVRGESMWPRFMDGDVIVIDKTQLALVSLIGKTCYVQLDDGRCFLKIVQKGSVPGHWNLISHNAPPIENVVIDRAYPVVWVRPKL